MGNSGNNGESCSLPDYWSRSFANLWGWNEKASEASVNMAKGAQTYWAGIFNYVNEFVTPSWAAMSAFATVEKKKLERAPFTVYETLKNYAELMQFNLELGARQLTSSFLAINEYQIKHANEILAASFSTLFGSGGEDIASVTGRQGKFLDFVVNAYPRAILDIESEYGFHFDNGGYVKAAETERFCLYRVLPTDKGVKVRENGKPIIIIPPVVLGPNILAFLPGENKSYVHCFANQGIPTYARILKDVASTPAVQVMTGEDDARDTRFFCEQLAARHGRPVTLNGICQGGFMAAVDVMSGELDGVVDALITCVAPMDGSRSKSIIEYMKQLPPRFRDLGHSMKTLPNGNRVVDGKILGWVYKLRSIEKESPVATFHRDISMFERPGQPLKVNKTAAAINHWMIHDRTDLPAGIVGLSFESYTTPVDREGNLPIKLFGRALNFKRIKEKGVKWLICIAEKDDLVEKESSLAPLDYVDAEVSVYPKGHVAIATSWSLPTSECALHKSFVPNGSQSACLLPETGSFRGPVRYQLDLEEALGKEDGAKGPRVEVQFSNEAELAEGMVATLPAKKSHAA